MKKLLTPGDILKLGLAGALDIFEEIGDPLGIMAKGCKELYGWVSPRYRRHNFSRVVARALKTGGIKKVIKKGEVYLRLSSQGKEKLRRDFPLLSFQKKKWDKKWRLVVYDIKEISRNTRDRLREKLRELGLGMLQQSVWISPHDIAVDFREFLESKNLEKFVFVMEVFHLLAGDEKVLANKVWKLDNLNKAYKKLYESIKDFKEMYMNGHGRGTQRTFIITIDEKMKGERMKDERGKEEKGKRQKTREIEKRAREIKSQYLQILLEDPFLPRELLPKDWMGEKVREEIKRFGEGGMGIENIKNKKEKIRDY